MSSALREEKLALLAALQEKKRRLKKEKPPFKANPGQEKVIKSDALIRVVTSGNGSGKTALAVYEAVCVLKGHNPISGRTHKVPNKVIYVLDKPSKVADKIVPEIKKFFDTEGWEWKQDGTPGIRRGILPSGSELVFMFHEMVEMSFESIDGYSLVVYDEPPPHHVFKGLLRGGRSKGYHTRHLFCGTPIGPNASWLRTDLLERWKQGDKEVEVFTYSTDENKDNLDWDQVEKNFRFLSEREIEIRRHGQWSDLEGLALAHLWQDSVHIVDAKAHIDQNSPCVVAIDPHPTKPHVAVMVAVDKDNRLYVIKELKEKMVPRLFAKRLHEWMAGHRVIDIVVDNLGSADGTGGEGFKSFITVLQEERVRCRPTTYDEKVDGEWITRMQSDLAIPQEPDNFGQRIPRLRFDPSVRTVISDIKNVQWVKLRNLDEYRPTLEISNKDGLSCLKYALAAGLFFNKPAKTKPHYLKKAPYRGISLRVGRNVRPRW